MTRLDAAIPAIARTVSEMQRVAPALKRGGRLAKWPERMLFLLESYSLGAHENGGSGAFTYNPEELKISFCADALSGVHEAATRFAHELHSLKLDRERLIATTTNLYVIHELTHITQNLPHYHLVARTRAGLGPEAIAHLDVVADFNAAWAAAHIEWMIAGCPTRPTIRDYFTMTLMLSYVIGARGFPPNERPHKIKRFLGVILGAVLNEADNNGILTHERLHPDWHPAAPLYMFDLGVTSELNAMMVNPFGLLFSGEAAIAPSRALEIWGAVEHRTVAEIYMMLTKALANVGVVKGSSQHQVGARA